MNQVIICGKRILDVVSVSMEKENTTSNYVGFSGAVTVETRTNTDSRKRFD
jgi:hypothetical protein